MMHVCLEHDDDPWEIARAENLHGTIFFVDLDSTYNFHSTSFSTSSLVRYAPSFAREATAVGMVS